MDFTGIAALAGVPVAIVIAFIPSIAERSSMKRLERLVSLRANLPSDGSSSESVDLQIEELAMRMRLALFAPRFLLEFLLGLLIAAAGTVVYFTVLFQDLDISFKKGHTFLEFLAEVPTPSLPFALALIFIIVGIGVALFPFTRRYSWEKQQRLSLPKIDAHGSEVQTVGPTGTSSV